MKISQKFKIRASAGGKLMTESKGKTNRELYDEAVESLNKLKFRYSEFKNKDCKSAVDIVNKKIPEQEVLISELEKIKDKIELSETTKTFLQEWVKEIIYNVKKDIKNKYLTKGLTLEDTAIDKAIEWLDLPFAIKNEQFFEDDYFMGTPDLIVDGVVYDTKCSWDCFTFPLFSDDIPNKDYYYQLQIYMHLTGMKKACLVYILLNTPENLPSWEEKKNYDNLDKKYKIKTFEFNYDPEVIEKLKQKVIESRNYIKTLNYE